MRAGDIILFSGKGLVSRLIQLGGLTKYSHVGIMIDEEHILESTTLSNLDDVILGKKISGVQVVKLKDRLDTYEGKVYHRQLVEPLSEEMKFELNTYAAKYHGREYEASKWDLIKAELSWLPNPTSDLETLFCSELVVQLLQDIGMYTPNNPSDSFTPEKVSKILPKEYKDARRLG